MWGCALVRMCLDICYNYIISFTPFYKRYTNPPARDQNQMTDWPVSFVYVTFNACATRMQTNSCSTLTAHMLSCCWLESAQLWVKAHHEKLLYLIAHLNNTHPAEMDILKILKKLASSELARVSSELATCHQAWYKQRIKPVIRKEDWKR